MKYQRGVSLIEMMIALVVSLFLILGLGAIFLSMRGTSIDRQGLSALQNSERLAMQFIAVSVQSAGFYPQGTTLPAGTVPISGTLSTNPLHADTLTVNFRSPATSEIQGCSATLTPNTMYTEVFSVSGGNLVCTENTVAKQLVSGISGMDIVYGIDAASPASGSVTKYVDASALTTPAQWATVKTVRVTLLFANPLAGQSGQGATVSFSRTMAYLNGL